MIVYVRRVHKHAQQVLAIVIMWIVMAMVVAALVVAVIVVVVLCIVFQCSGLQNLAHGRGRIIGCLRHHI